jgi:hypothetical protein
MFQITTRCVKQIAAYPEASTKPENLPIIPFELSRCAADAAAWAHTDIAD